jgi:hypothetical protein
MYHIDPDTMILDLGGNKKLEITADVIYKLFALPRGNDSPPRPSEEYVIPLRDLKDELGIPRDEELESDDLRKILEGLVLDDTKDALALKVFGLMLYNKFICPGYHPRIKKEATMVVDFDLVKLKYMQLCQLVVDELRIAITLWQGADKPGALPGCVVAPILAYLDCLDHRIVDRKNRSIPRAIHLDPKLLAKLVKLDLVKEGGPDPRSWKYGKLPVSHLFPFLFCTAFYFVSSYFLAVYFLNCYIIRFLYCSRLCYLSFL